ncbi:unnamed protein product, partial [Cladocopium goreaui]
ANEKPSPAQKGQVLRRLLGYADRAEAKSTTATPPAAKRTKAAPKAAPKAMPEPEPSSRAVEALAAATEVALVCGQMLRQGKDWQSEVDRELRHHLPDVKSWSWEIGEACRDEDATVSLFAESEGSEVAVILDPWRDELFTALRGGGAEMNCERLTCAAGDALEDVLVGTASSADTEISWPQLRGIYYLGPPRSRGVRILQNASLGHAWVAAGRLGSFFSVKSSRAGALLVKEAGGDFQEGGISAANSSLRQQVEEVLQEAEVLKFLSAETSTV